MLKLGADWMLSRIIDAAFMVLATMISILGGYYYVAALFGAKAILDIINTVLLYRRNQRLRFQLREHLFRDDLD